MKILKSIFILASVLILSTLATNSYFTDQATVAGNTFQAGTWPPRVVINEVYYDPTGSDTGNEWIEIYNGGGQAADLTNYQLGSAGKYYTFPAAVLNPDNFIVIHWNTAGTNTATELYTGTTGFSNMGNSSGFVALFNSTTRNSSTIIDYLEYGAGGQTWESTAVTAGIWTAGDFVSDVVAGHSLERNPKGKDTDTASDFIDQSSPTPGTGL